MKIKYQGVYGIFDKDGSCWYVGQSINIEQRWKVHKGKIHDEWHNEMQARLDDFTFKILEIVDDITKLREREDYYIDLLNPKYTSKKSNRGSHVGTAWNKGLDGPKPWNADKTGVYSEETIKRMSKAGIGRTPWNKGMTGLTPWNAGKTGIYSEETLKKMSAVKKGKHLTDETKTKISASLKGENHPMYGKHLTDETKTKLSALNKGKHLTDETKTKISASNKGCIPWNKGKQLTDETKAKMRASHKGQIPWNKGKTSK